MRKIYMNFLFFCLACFSVSATAEAANVHLVHRDYQPQIVSHYRLIDLGATEVDLSKLSKIAQKMSYAPAINNSAQGMGNREVGGFVFLPMRWEYSPQMAGMKVNFHGINNRGDLLVTLARSGSSLEWMVWPREEGGYGNTRKHVQTVDLFDANFFLSCINDCGQVVGYRVNNGKNQPILWSQETGVRPLGKDKGLQLYGIARAINAKGSVAGITDEAADHAPFFWNEKVGLEVMKSYRSQLRPKGWVEFADLVLTEDDTLYGTFWIKHLSNSDRSPRYTTYFAYSWSPRTGNVKNLDMLGMRIADVNSSHCLVGSVDGKAVLRKRGYKPVFLSDIINISEQADWELLEATGINDSDQIVGYGTYQGKPHLFLAEPITKESN